MVCYGWGMTSTPTQPTFQVHTVVNRYCDIVRENGTVQVVLDAIGEDGDPDNHAGEIVYELCETAYELFGSRDNDPTGDGDPDEDDRRFDRLQDALTEVIRNLTTGVPMVRRCRICTQEVTSSDPAVDYCQWCYYGGCIYAEQHKDLIEAIHETCRYSKLVADVVAQHTGGGCFVIEVTFAGDRSDYVWLSEAQDIVTCDDPTLWVLGHYPDREDDHTEDGIFDATPRTVADAAAHVLLCAVSGW